MAENLKNFKDISDYITDKRQISGKQYSKELNISYSYYKKLRSGERKGLKGKGAEATKKTEKDYSKYFKHYTFGYLAKKENYYIYKFRHFLTDDPNSQIEIIKSQEKHPIEEIKFVSGNKQEKIIDYFLHNYDRDDIINWDYMLNIVDEENPNSDLLDEFG